jgi:hypothetical protein
VAISVRRSGGGRARVAIGLGDLSHALGALAVLALNLACLTAAAVATLAIQRRSGG